MSVELSIVIVSFNTLDLTRRCLVSLHDASLDLSHEIILVDNASEDGTADMVEGEFPDVILIRNSENRMYARANNQALRRAHGDLVILLNSDTRVPAGQLEILHAFLAENRHRVGCVGPRIVNPDGSTQIEGGVIDGFRFVFSNLVGMAYWPLPRTWKSAILPPGTQRGLHGVQRRVGYVSGSALMTTRYALDRVGLLDEDLFFYNEDIDYCLRLAKAGLESWSVPAAVVFHELGGSTKGRIANVIQERRVSSRRHHVRKHYGLPRWRALCLTKLLCYTPLLAVASVLRRPVRHSLAAQLGTAVRDLRRF